MRRSLIATLLLLLTLMSALSGCGARPTAGRQDLTWDGTTLNGLPFYVREFSMVRIHYTDPTMPDMAERLGEYAQKVLEKHKAWGRLSPGERLDVWLLPEGQGWPKGAAGLAENQIGLADIQALGPRAVLLPSWYLMGQEWERTLEWVGLPDAMAVALSQGAGSPAFSVQWIHDGLGRVMAQELGNIPGGLWVQHFPGRWEYRNNPWKIDDILNMLDPTYKPSPGILPMSPDEAAGAVMALVIDRWGLNWWEYYEGKPEDLTPMAAMRWATGASSDDEAITRFRERMGGAIDNHAVLQSAANVVWPVTLADQGANRLKPELKQLPVADNNQSDLAYRFDVRYDPVARDVSGDVVLTWTNGEGIPVDRLYFNLWGNSTGALWYGGYTVVDSVTVNGQSVDFATRGMDLDVPLVQGVQPGERTEVRITFRTRLPIARLELPLEPGKGQEPPPKPKAGEEHALSLWYPALAVLDEKGWRLDSFTVPDRAVADRADYEVRITVPQGTRVERLGAEPQVTEAGGRFTYQFAGQDNLWSATLVTE